MRRGLLALALAAPLAATAQEPPVGAGPRGTSQDFGAERYDAVGYASVAPALGTGPVVAHPSLPAGSFVEVTALDTGTTALLQVSARMAPALATRILELSPAAASALGISLVGAVRVRAVTPSPADLASLRAGQAPLRLPAPAPLLAALRKRVPIAIDAPMAPRPPRVGVRPPPPVARPAAPPQAAAPSIPAPSSGGFFVQLWAFASRERAQALAGQAGGTAVAAGRLWRVRAGPYADRASAERARADLARRGLPLGTVVTE